MPAIAFPREGTRHRSALVETPRSAQAAARTLFQLHVASTDRWNHAIKASDVSPLNMSSETDAVTIALFVGS
jgi:hypothetical protein